MKIDCFFKIFDDRVSGFSRRTPEISIVIIATMEITITEAAASAVSISSEISPGPDVCKCPYDLCFTQYLLGSAFTGSFPLRRSARAWWGYFY